VRLHQSVVAQTGRLAVRYDPQHRHLFDAASGLRLEQAA
jgi:hypothetical protein